MKEPLQHFIDRIDLYSFRIGKHVSGEKFFGIMLDDGRIGICSTLGYKPDISILRKGRINNLTDPCKRIVVNAWLNAICNYSGNYETHADIFDRIDFSGYGKTVMIGYFETLHEKFIKSGIDVKIFDMKISSENLEPMESMPSALAESDAVIITGTAIFNGTFNDLISYTPEDCDVFLLGPSNILHADMLMYRNVKIVFGSVFERFDTRIFESISQGLGARNFLNDNNKVFLTAPNFILR